MRYSDLRLLRWCRIDLVKRRLYVGKSNTEAGTGRMIPLNDRATMILQWWAEQFPNREPEDYVSVGTVRGSGEAFSDALKPHVFHTNPHRPISSWKVAWTTARSRAGVRCRFHDLHHTGCTRVLGDGQPFAVVATLIGWSAATTARIAKRYGHICEKAQREAVAVLDGSGDRLRLASVDRSLEVSH